MLDLNENERGSAHVLDAMRRPTADVDRLAGSDFDLDAVECHLADAGQGEPVLRAMSMTLVAQTAAR